MEKSDTRVLLFEKDRNFASVIEGILKSEGYEVETASTLV
jgi:DNA-binding response OmpR family regulator